MGDYRRLSHPAPIATRVVLKSFGQQLMKNKLPMSAFHEHYS